MKASELNEALQFCKSSLLSLDFVPVLTHFCFTGKEVYAYNDLTAVIAQLDSGLKFLVHGETLLNLVSTFDPEKEVIFESNDTSVSLKCGRARIELAKLGLEERKDFAFKAPTLSSHGTLKITEHLIIAVTKALETVLNDAHQKALTGLLLTVAPSQITIHSSNNTCITRTEVEVEEKNIEETTSYLLPKTFCEQLLGLYGKAGAGVLVLSDSWTAARFEKASLYTKNMQEKPPSLENVLVDLIPPEDDAVWAANSSDLSTILRRASIMSDDRQCVLKGEKKAIRVIAEGARGQLNETLPLKTKGLADIEIKIDSVMVDKALAHAEFFALTEKALIAVGNDYVRAVAAIGKE